MQRHIYLEKQTLKQARKIFFKNFNWKTITGIEKISTIKALGRVTANPIFATFSSPLYHTAAMDGAAVKAENTFGASEETPIFLKIDQEIHLINTGQPLPTDTNAVIMIEQLNQINSKIIEINTAAFPWQHVRKVGEDIIAKDMLFPHHQRLGPTELSTMLTAGIFQVNVIKQPIVAIITTGTELKNWHEISKDSLNPGDIIESNSILLASLVNECGGKAIIWPCQLDNYKLIKKTVEQALTSNAHLIILNAGASAGSKDYTAHIFKKLGQILVHGITTMPGKPSILGIAEGKPLIGTPGYPVSAWLCFDQFIHPALHYMQGQTPIQRKKSKVKIAQNIPSKLGQEEFLRVHLGLVNKQIVAIPLKRGAGSITSLTKADGIIRIPLYSEGIEEGTKIVSELLKPRKELKNTLLIVGSHDIILDILADYIKYKYPYIKINSSNVGSLAGLMAIKNGYSHLGGTHLLDQKSGKYNIEYIKKHLSAIPIVLISLAWRKQGLIVKKGNPKQILKLTDLTRKDVVFVNRQIDSGTRILLEYFLKKMNIKPSLIQEYYSNCEYTHTGVAIQIISGGADCGLGIQAVANALKLDFIPLYKERYDLCIPLTKINDYKIQILLETLKDINFKNKIKQIKGYDISCIGKEIWRN